MFKARPAGPATASIGIVRRPRDAPARYVVRASPQSLPAPSGLIARPVGPPQLAPTGARPSATKEGS